MDDVKEVLAKALNYPRVSGKYLVADKSLMDLAKEMAVISANQREEIARLQRMATTQRVHSIAPEKVTSDETEHY